MNAFLYNKKKILLIILIALGGLILLLFQLILRTDKTFNLVSEVREPPKISSSLGRSSFSYQEISDRTRMEAEGIYNTKVRIKGTLFFPDSFLKNLNKNSAFYLNFSVLDIEPFYFREAASGTIDDNKLHFKREDSLGIDNGVDDNPTLDLSWGDKSLIFDWSVEFNENSTLYSLSNLFPTQEDMISIDKSLPEAVFTAGLLYDSDSESKKFNLETNIKQKIQGDINENGSSSFTFGGAGESFVSIIDYSELLNESTSSIRVVSPNGGEKWMIGSTHAIKWEIINPPRYNSVDLVLVGGKSGAYFHPVPNIDSYLWTIRPFSFSIVDLDNSAGTLKTFLKPGNDYKIRANLYKNPPPCPFKSETLCASEGFNSDKFISFDTSDAPFMIVSISSANIQTSP